MSETQDSQIRHTIPENIAKPLSDRFVRIFKNSNDGLYYGKRFNGSIELIGSSGPSTDERVKVRSTDTTAGFLVDKIVAGSNIGLIVLNPGGDEKLQINAPSPSSESLVASYIPTMSIPAGSISPIGNWYFKVFPMAGNFRYVEIWGKFTINTDPTPANSPVEFFTSIAPGWPIVSDPQGVWNVSAPAAAIGNTRWHLNGILPDNPDLNNIRAFSEDGKLPGALIGTGTGHINISYVSEIPT